MKIAVVDLETLGMAATDAVIELGVSELTYESGAERSIVDRLDDWLFGIPEGQTMSADNRAVHHIDPASLVGLELFRPEGATFAECDYACAHNAEYEQQYLTAVTVPWLCTYKIALRLWPDFRSHGNQALKYELGIPDSPAYHPPHRAGPDAYLTAHVLHWVLHEALEVRGHTIEELVQWTTEPRLLPRCPIGKFRNKPWSEVDYGFLDWMLRQADMEHDLKWNARREIDRRRTERMGS